ncbi:MAG: glycosyltransferase [Candidatus Eisenbacteria bacterium]|uniref:Glycosyltransferase n=1 Tax=Eiseniibacteriota bacterium TaxID=2212470 RepID=A0A9D6L7Q0_UNCEI|nr:glycosyltransferase [Candidatus Eisenbacteria bacterium]
MRIGIVTQSYYPRYGGVTEHVHHTAVELRRRGHEVTIITGRFRDGDEERHEQGVERIGTNIMVPFNRAFIDFTVGFSLRQQLRRLFHTYNFEVLHTHSPNAPSLPVLAVQEAWCAQVGTFHTTAGRSLLQDLFCGYLARTTIRRLDRSIAVSKTAEASTRLYYPGDYRVIPNGVDVERFHPAVEPIERWQDPEFINLLFVGRLDPRKGLQYLLAAMPEIVEGTAGRARLLVVGDSYLRTRFEAQVTPALRGHIHFLGHVPSADLPRWYATGDIFVSPASGNESFGIVLVEAMAAGVPVVATDIPGFTVDEAKDHLGSRLMLPPWLEPRRAQLMQHLSPIRMPAA